MSTLFYITLGVLLAACGGGAKKTSSERSGQVDALTPERITLVSGDGQTTTPAALYTDLVFELSAAARLNIEDEFNPESKFFDIGLKPDATAADVQAAWNAGAPAVGAPSLGAADPRNNGLDPNKALGQIFETAKAFDDAKGTILITMRVLSSTLHKKHVAFAMRLPGIEGPEGIAFARLATTDFGSRSELSFSTTNELLETAGVGFDVDVKALDEAGNLVETFTGAVPLAISAAPKSSWLGKTAKFPRGKVVCQFKAGLCKLPGGPFTLTAEGSLPVTMTDQGNDFKAVNTIKTVRGKAAHLIFVANDEDHAVLGTLAADLKQTMTFSADLEDVVVRAALADAGGNFIGYATGGSWVVTGPLLPSLAAGKGLEKTLEPATVGTGTVKVSAPAGVTATADYAVIFGQLHHFMIGVEDGGAQTLAVPFAVTVSARDVDNNLVTVFAGEKSLVWATEAATPNAENGFVTLPADANYTFVAGEMTTPASATSFVATSDPKIVVLHTAGSSTVSGRSVPVTVDAGTPDHYGIVPQEAAPEADSLLATTFALRVESRDTWGNPAATGGTGVILTIEKADGSAAGGTLAGTVGPLDLSAGFVDINNLAYDLAGERRFKASSTAGIDASDATSSPAVAFTASIKTVDTFAITAPTTVTAGTSFNATVSALDAEGVVITGIDGALSTPSFTWSGAAAAPSTTAPVYPSTLTFSAGSATAALTLYKAETLATGALTIATGNGPPRSGGTDGAVLVNPATLNRYVITANQTTRFAAPSSLFNLTIEAQDVYRNRTPGDGSLTVDPEYVSGTNVAVGNIAGAAVSGLDLTAGTLTLASLNYDVAQTVKFKLTGSSAPGTLQSAQIQFQPSSETVHHFDLTIVTPTLTAGGDLTVQVTAKDILNNVITGADDGLDALVFAWSGAANAVDATAPDWQTSGDFTNGVATFVHTLYKAETIASGALELADNFGTPRTGEYTGGAIVVSPAAATVMTVDTIAAQVAGTAFNITAAVTDDWENPTASGCTTLAVTGGTTSVGGHGMTATAPVLPAAAAQDSLGHYTLTGLKLHAEGANSLTLAACSLTPQVKAVTVADAAVTAAVSLHGTNVVPASTDAGLTETFCPLSGAGTDVACTDVYAFFWDAYGNNVDGTGASCSAWSYATIGAAPTPVVSGTGHTYALTHTDYVNGTLTCTKGAVSKAINAYGGVSHIKLTHNYTAPGPILAALNNLTVSKIELLSTKGAGQVETAYPFAAPQSETIGISSTSTTPDLGQPASTSCSFGITGQCTSALPFDLTEHESAVAPILNTGNRSITLTVRGKSAAVTGINVKPAGATTLTVDPIGAQVAGVPFGATVTVTDSFGNLTNGTGSGNDCTTAPNLLDVGGGTTSPGGHDGTATAPVRPVDVTQTAVGTYNVTGIELFKKGNETLTFTACGLSAVNASVTVAETDANAVYFSTTDAAPATQAAPALAALECANSGAVTGSAVTCAAIYTYFWDAYGNQLADTSCDAWSYTTNAGAPAPVVSGTGHSYTVSHTDYIDGKLTCTKDGASSETNVYGGVSRIALAHDYTAPGPILAGLNNINVSTVTLYRQRNGVEQVKTFGSTSTETIGVATTSTDADIGQPASLTCGFATTGICSTAMPFDMTLHESAVAPILNTGNRSITLTVRGKSAAITGINVKPALPATLTVTPIGAQVAGVAFGASATVTDAFANLTDGTGTAKDCTTVANRLDIGGGTTSPGGHEGTATAPVLPVDQAQASVGTFTVTGIELFKKGSETITFTACGLSAVNASVTVAETVANAVYFSTTDAAPATQPAPALNTLECANSGAATAASVTCAAIYTFFWDEYGNQLSNTSCDAWSYATNAAAPAPTVSGTGHSYTVSHTDYIDGRLKCVKDAAESETNVYGGVSRIALAHDYTAPGPILAALNNINVSTVTLYRQRNGSEEVKTFGSTSTETIGVATTSTDADIGQPASLTCGFATTGICSTAMPFDMTLHESAAAPILNTGNRSITLTVRGKSAAITSINVRPAAASALTVAAIAAQTAGATFGATVTTRDQFANLTDGAGTAKDCTVAGDYLDVTGGNSSPGGHEGAVTAPVLASDVAQTSFGQYAVTGLQLFKKGSESINFTACGLAAVPAAVSVNPAAANTVYYNTADAEPPNVASPYISELKCANSGAATASNVTCGALYAYFYDDYGNLLNDLSCDSWSYATIGAAPAPTVSGTGHSLTLTHTDYIDGNLKCTKGAVANTTLNTYGGVAYVELTHDYDEANDPLRAAADNVNVSEVRLFSYHNGVAELKTDAGGGETIGIATNSTLGVTGIGFASGTTTCNFAGGGNLGKCVTNIPFDFTKHESSEDEAANALDYNNGLGNRSLTLTVRGKTASITGMDIHPAAASALTVTALGTKIAGTAFTATVAVRDAFNNFTDGWGTAKDCTVAKLAVTGGTNSPGGHGSGAAATPTMPADIFQTSLGNYTTGNITLVKDNAAEALTFTSCGLTGVAASANVGPGAANAVYYNTTDTAPPDVAPPYLSELSCPNSGAVTASSVTCPTIYTFFYDAYGNLLDDLACGAWSYATISGAPAPVVSGTGHSYNLTHTDWIDGNLKCTKGAVTTTTINTYGGISSIVLTDDYPEPGPIFAAADNIGVSQVQLRRFKNGVLEDKAYTVPTTETVSVATTSTSTIGNTPTYTCSFSTTGLCSTEKRFDFTKAEYADLANGNKTMTMTVRGKSAQVTSINVKPTAAYNVTVDAITAKVANVGFTASVYIRDQFANITEEGCEAAEVAVTGGNTSAGGHMGTATAPSLPVNVTTDSTPDRGHFTTGTIKLFAEGTNTLTYTVSGCATPPSNSSVATGNVTVNDALASAVYLSTTDTPPASGVTAPGLTEVQCVNSVGAATVCPAVYAFFWDAYGNAVDDEAGNLCNTWTYSNISGSGTPAASGATHARTLTHAAYLDGDMTCNKDGQTGTVHTYGGVSRVEITHDYAAPVTANTDNLYLQEMRAYLRKNNVEIPADNLAGAKSIAISTTLTQGAAALGQSNPFNCTYDAFGVCGTDIPFDLTLADTNKTLTFTLFGVAAPSITGITVNPNVQFKYRLTSAGATKTAGTPFTVTVTAYDQFSNVATGYAGTDNLSFSWAGTTATNSNYGPGHNVSAAVTATNDRTFAAGVWTSAADFILYKETDATPVLNMVSNTNAFIVETPLSGITVTHNGTVNYVKVHDVSTAGTSWTPDFNTHTMVADATKTLYSHGYDAWGNHVALASVSWTADAQLAGRLAPTTGTSTIVTPVLIGSGTVTADHATATDDSTGMFTINHGTAASYTVTTAAVSPLTAGQDLGVTLTARDNDGNVATGYTGSKNLTWTTPNGTNAPLGTAPKKLANGNRTFAAGVYTTGATDFAFYNGADSNVKVRATDGTINGETSGFAMQAGTSNNLLADAVTAKVANEAFTIAAQLRDAWNNPTTAGCAGTMAVGDPGGNTSPGAHGGAATGPSLPAAAAQDGVGHYTTASVKLFKEGANTLGLDACGVTTSVPVTVTPAATATIYLNNVNTAPAAHLTNVNCTTGATVSCPTLYAFAWDAYGNEVDDGAYSCASYTYINDNASPYDTPAVTPSSSSGHSSSVSSANWHVDGVLRCTSGAVQAQTDMNLTKIVKNYGFSCGAWSCAAADTPRGTCTVSNTSGYATKDYDFSGADAQATLDDTACSAGVAVGGNCSLVVDGAAGEPSGSIAVLATAGDAHATFVTLTDPAAAAVGAGALAPNCSAVLSDASSAWSCVAGASRIQVTLTNDNDLNGAALPVAPPSFSPVGGYTLVTNNCRNTTLTPGNSCTDTIETASAAQSTTLSYTPSDGFFAVTGVPLTSPNCTQDARVVVAVTQACAGLPKAKTLTLTVHNDNTLQSVSFGANAVTPADGGVVTDDQCSSGSVAPGTSCTVEVAYSAAPSVNDLSLTISESSGYMNDVVVTTADGDNSCP